MTEPSRHPNNIFLKEGLIHITVYLFQEIQSFPLRVSGKSKAINQRLYTRELEGRAHKGIVVCPRIKTSFATKKSTVETSRMGL